MSQMRIGIALSGGGVRATVFHLGVLARIAEDSQLENISFISSVSGGTLAAGLIYTISANRWPSSVFYLNTCIPQARHYLTEVDIEANALFRLITKPWMILKGKANILSESISQCWNVKGNLTSIPSVPRWVINTTAYESGKNWRIMPQKMGDYVLNYVEKPNVALSDAMAASAAYPGLIGPLKLSSNDFTWFKYDESSKGKTLKCSPLFQKIHLWDGGVYDNLGVEALFKPNGDHFRDEYNFLIVSDASKGITLEKSSFFDHKRAFRLLNIAMDQVRSLRARMLVSFFSEHNNSGVYLKIGNSASFIMEQAKGKHLTDNGIAGNTLSESETLRAANISTSLTKLSKEDFELLFRHGWEVANYTLQFNCPHMFSHRNYRQSN